MASHETEEQLEERHERESEELEEKISAHLEEVKANNKGKKAKAALDAAEREVDQWRYEMTERHSEEMDSLENEKAGNVETNESTDTGKQYNKSSSAPVEEAETEQERAARKKDKALQKRQNKSAKEAEKEAEREREKLEAGPSGRELEIAALTVALAKRKPPLTILEVAADGNCMYHAVADQIRRVRPEVHEWKLPAPRVYEEVRALCADALRKNVDDYAPFAELAEGEDYDGYCRRVEKSADWGGELELRAIADALRVKILVHRADESKPLELGDDKSRGDPLQLTYHQHYYSLGAHYNSAIMMDS